MEKVSLKKYVPELSKEISKIGIGTHQFSGEWGKKFSQEEVNSILYGCIKKGINHIDAAGSYGDHKSEDFIGNFINSKNRSKWIISSKFGYHYKNNIKVRDFSTNAVKKQLENSLRSLKTDYIDIYYFHSGNEKELDNDELWTLLDKKVKEGIIKTLGISLTQSVINNEDYKQLEIIKKYNILFIQVAYNLIDKRAEKIILPYCKKNNKYSVAKVPLAKGFLSNNYKIGHKFIDNARSDFGDDFNNSLLEKVKTLYSDIKIKNKTSWALKEILNDRVDFAIPGVKSLSQLYSNLELF